MRIQQPTEPLKKRIVDLPDSAQRALRRRRRPRALGLNSPSLERQLRKNCFKGLTCCLPNRFIGNSRYIAEANLCASPRSASTSSREPIVRLATIPLGSRFQRMSRATPVIILLFRLLKPTLTINAASARPNDDLKFPSCTLIISYKSHHVIRKNLNPAVNIVPKRCVYLSAEMRFVCRAW